MKISIIAAMGENREIGKDNQMPWHLSEDLKKFKKITMGSPILMGRRTFESIGRPLPGRENIIVSRNPSYQQDGCVVFHCVDEAVKSLCKTHENLFIIGGSTLYQKLLPRADRLYLTHIQKSFDADTYFPEFLMDDWQEIECFSTDDDPSVDFAYSFKTLLRRE